jgi:DNA-binding XRE family transcriptional regulator
MALTDFGKAVRKARLDANETLSTMADALSVSPAFLSALETGRKNISEEWIVKIADYFLEKGIKIEKLAEYADVSNQSVSIANCNPQQQMLIAGFARSSFDAVTLAKFAKLLGTDKE